MRALLHAFLRRFITRGLLTVRYPDGSVETYAGPDAGGSAAIEIRSERTLRRLVTDPALALGEAYMDGTFVPVGGTIGDVLDVLLHNVMGAGAHPGAVLHAAIRRLLRRWAQYNPAPRSRRNVALHYDLNDRLYALFLDRDWQYSCAYFPTGEETLEAAQEAKKRHIAAKLLLDRPGLTVLDIGCGWGGTALTLARAYGARVLGVTLSTEQLARARRRAAEAGLADQVRFELLDYRDPAIGGPFDRIVSVGMFEHVGINHYDAFFGRVRGLLRKDGVALIHAIGRLGGPRSTNPWLARYIFPGGYSPALSEVMPAVERNGLIATDLEVLRLHYAQTLRHWGRRFAARRGEAAALFDERFCRMFELYLAGSELAFRRLDHMVWQMQLTRDVGALPFTRDYIGAAERAVERVRESAA
jgi:cyclopropane-fatty-acyl-phospholipid synthase